MAEQVYASAKPNHNPPQALNGGGGGGQPSFPPTKGQTYGATLPAYRPQPRKPPPRRRRRRGCCCSCCLWVTLIVVALVFLAAIAAGVFYLIYHPRRPTFEVGGVRLAAFNVSAAGHITSRLDLNVTARNPNSKIAYLYDAASVSFFSGGVDIGDGSFPAFVQNGKNTTLLATTLSAGAQTLDSTAASDLRKKTSLQLEIDVDTKVGVKIGGLKTKRMGIHVRCVGIDVGVPKGKAAAPVASPDADCKWVLSPKHFKFPFPITLTMIHMGFSGVVAFFLVRVFKVVAPVKMTFQIYATCVIPISAFFASSLWFGNTAYLHISVAFIQMLKALMPVATFLMAVTCGTDKLRCDVFLNMVLVSVGVAISSYGEINFNVIGTAYQVTGIFAEALRLVLTQVLLQKKGLNLNPVTSLYYIAPCSFLFLFVPWYVLEKPGMEISQIQFNFWIFFSNALCALALNFSIFLVIGRTGAVTIRVAGVLKDWILIALSTIIFPESTITGLNIIGYAIALCGVVMYNYLKVRDVRASNQLPTESIPERATKEWKLDKKSDLYSDSSNNGRNIASDAGVTASDSFSVDEEAPLLQASRVPGLKST
ncbi:unnamed protein product [Musa hybrid cultivar]